MTLTTTSGTVPEIDRRNISILFARGQQSGQMSGRYYKFDSMSNAQYVTVTENGPEQLFIPTDKRPYYTVQIIEAAK